MTKSDIAQYRLQNQLILQSSKKIAKGMNVSSVKGIVSWLGAMQGQDFPGAKWAVGLRLKGSSDIDIEDAIAKREIVRTWTIRGTLHLVAADDIYWMTQLVAPKVIKASAGRRKQLELDEKTISKSHQLIVKGLEGGKTLTRSEIRQILTDHNIASNEFRLDHILQYAVMNQLISGGPRRGKEHTVVYLPDWIPATNIIPREEALGDLAKKFFFSHGPATIPDYAWWSGLSLIDCRTGLEMIKNQLVGETVEGQTFWMSKNRPGLKSDVPESVFLLPGFDEYMLGYKDRTIVVDPKYMNRIATNNGLFAATIVVNGIVEGTWRRTFIKKDVVIELYPFKRFNKDNKDAVKQEALKFGQFLGYSSETVKLVWN